jgi:hypothetical protein
MLLGLRVHIGFSSTINPVHSKQTDTSLARRSTISIIWDSIKTHGLIWNLHLSKHHRYHNAVLYNILYSFIEDVSLKGQRLFHYIREDVPIIENAIAISIITIINQETLGLIAS